MAVSAEPLKLLRPFHFPFMDLVDDKVTRMDGDPA